jgi:hypothetical protein
MIQVAIETTKTVVHTRRRGFEAKIVEFAEDFVQGLDITRRDFETQLNEVEGQAHRELMAVREQTPVEYKHQIW